MRPAEPALPPAGEHGCGSGGDAAATLGIATSYGRVGFDVDAPSLSQKACSDRRAGSGRRRSGAVFSWFRLHGGRRYYGGRRAADDPECFVDMHGPWLFLAAVVIVALNFLDAWFTVYFLSVGGQELNPMVDWVLSQGTWAFVLMKSLGIGVCVAVLTMTKNFKLARIGIAIVLVGYSALLGWHLYLDATHQTV